MKSAHIVIASVLLFALAGCAGTVSHHAAASKPSAASGPAKQSSGSALTDTSVKSLVADWNTASQTGNTTELYEVSLGLPSAVTNPSCWSMLSGPEKTWLTSHGAEAQSQISADQKASSDGSLTTLDIFTAWDGYVKFVTGLC